MKICDAGMLAVAIFALQLLYNIESSTGLALSYMMQRLAPALVLLGLPGARGALPLPTEGTPPPLVMSSELVVAVAPDAPSQEQWAAKQLATWLGAMPGSARNCSAGWPQCAPALVSPADVGAAPAVFVGAGAAEAVGVPHAELHSLG